MPLVSGVIGTILQKRVDFHSEGEGEGKQPRKQRLPPHQCMRNIEPFPQYRPKNHRPYTSSTRTARPALVHSTSSQSAASTSSSAVPNSSSGTSISVISCQSQLPQSSSSNSINNNKNNINNNNNSNPQILPNADILPLGHDPLQQLNENSNGNVNVRSSARTDQGQTHQVLRRAIPGPCGCLDVLIGRSEVGEWDIIGVVIADDPVTNNGHNRDLSHHSLTSSTSTNNTASTNLNISSTGSSTNNANNQNQNRTQARCSWPCRKSQGESQDDEMAQNPPFKSIVAITKEADMKF